MVANLLDNIIDGERMIINLNSTLDYTLGQSHIYIRIIHDRICHKRVYNTLEVAHAAIGCLSDKLDYIKGNLKTVALTLSIQNVDTQLWIGLFQLGYQSAGKTGEQAVLNTCKVYRRTVASQNNLLAHTEQMIENVEEGIECLGRVYPLLDIINNQQIDVLIEVDEVVSGILTYRIGELDLEQAGTYIEHTLLWVELATLQADGINKVGLTAT